MKYGSQWIPLGPDGSQGIPVDPKGYQWISMDPNGFQLIPMDPNGSLCSNHTATAEETNINIIATA